VAEGCSALVHYSRVGAARSYGLRDGFYAFDALDGPTLTPWSMGIITVLPVLRLMILSMRIDVPLNLIPRNCCIF
jgi:hypothetical protein